MFHQSRAVPVDTRQSSWRFWPFTSIPPFTLTFAPTTVHDALHGNSSTDVCRDWTLSIMNKVNTEVRRREGDKNLKNLHNPGASSHTLTETNHRQGRTEPGMCNSPKVSHAEAGNYYLTDYYTVAWSPTLERQPPQEYDLGWEINSHNV